MGRNRKPRVERHLLPSETRPYVNRVFHVWCRAIDDIHAFPERRDKRAFLEMFERHLSKAEIKDSSYRPYRKLFDDVEVIACNVLDNHYHLVILQKRPGGLLKLMAAVLTAYGHYFNNEHGRRAQIFESPYSVRLAENRADVRGLIEYVHTNNEVVGPNYEFSTHRNFMGRARADWISVELGLKLFGGKRRYEVAVWSRWEESNAKKALAREIPLQPRRQLKRGRASHIPQPAKPHDKAK